MTSLSVLAMRLAPELCSRHKKPSQKQSQEPPPLQKRREAERQKAHLGAASESDAARTLISVPQIRTGGARPLATSWRGRARLSAPHRGSHRVLPRLGFRAALPGITGCKREDPLRHQCSEHLAVQHVPDGTLPKPPVRTVYRRAHENRPRSALRSTLANGVLRRAGCFVSNCDGDKSQACLFIWDDMQGERRGTNWS